MSKYIETLVPDIYQVLRNSLDGKGIALTVDQQAELGARIADKVARALNRPEKHRPPKTLYMSEIGKPCLRQLWYTVHTPWLGEKLLPHTQFKFLYGDILEELVLFLAKVSGHKVEGEQESLELQHRGWRIVGRRDAIIDDVLVDVKSASSYSFKKFKEGMDNSNDAFGYRMQLQAYDTAEKRSGYRTMGWLAVDKQNGTLAYSEHRLENCVHFVKRLDDIIEALDRPVEAPRAFALVPEGKSGNQKLGVECSYCSFKKTCWPGLRAFAYERGPVFLGTVVKVPNVPEIPLEADSESPEESVDAGSAAGH